MDRGLGKRISTGSLKSVKANAVRLSLSANHSIESLDGFSAWEIMDTSRGLAT